MEKSGIDLQSWFVFQHYPEMFCSEVLLSNAPRVLGASGDGPETGTEGALQAFSLDYVFVMGEHSDNICPF